MNKRKLGRTLLHVSPLCLDTAKFGWANDEATAFALLDTYHAGGGSFIASLSSARGGPANQSTEGSSEDIVGRWRETRSINRDDLVLASRITLTRPAPGGTLAFVNLVREACERSLRRLRTRYLDLLICDWDESLLPIDDFLEAVDLLLRAGVLRHAIAGGFPSWRLVDSLHRSSTRNHPRFEALQAEYSLLSRGRFEREALAMCREHRLGFLARSPLAGGFLAQRPALRDVVNLDQPWQSERFGSNVGDAVLKVLAEIADGRHTSPARVALAWVLGDAQVTSAVVSAPGPRELRELLGAADVVLTPDETAALADVTTVQDPRMELRHV